MHLLAARAMTDDFKDAAHTAYDTAIKKKAEEFGFAAFNEAFRGGYNSLWLAAGCP